MLEEETGCRGIVRLPGLLDEAVGQQVLVEGGEQVVQVREGHHEHLGLKLLHIQVLLQVIKSFLLKKTQQRIRGVN